MYNAVATAHEKEGANSRKRQGRILCLNCFFLSWLKIILFHQDLGVLTPDGDKDHLNRAVGKFFEVPSQDHLACNTPPLILSNLL